MDKSGIPNIVSYSRFVLTPILYILLLTDHQDLFIVLFILGSATDMLDGYLARHLKCTSRFGSRLDSLADYIYFGSVPVWILIGTPVGQKAFTPFIILGISTIAFVSLRILTRTHTFYHLWSAKIATFTVFLAGALAFLGVEEDWPIWLMTSFIIAAHLEEIAIIMGINSPPRGEQEW